MADVCLIVMSRAPVPGETKTRLIPALGAEGAMRLHMACLADLLDEADGWRKDLAGAGRSVALTLSITPVGSERTFLDAGATVPAHVSIVAQRGESLGARMHAALKDGLDIGDRVLLTGCDLPLLTRSHWAAADRLLDLHDVVLGPSADGGYYLIGIRRHARPGWEDLLDLDAWGTGTVLERTLARAHERKVSIGKIAMLPDLDVPEDAQRVLTHPLAKILSARRGVTLLRERFGT